MRSYLAAAVLIALCAAPVAGEVWIVGQGDSIQKAIDLSAAGDTISVVSGPLRYVENLTWANKDLTIRGSSPTSRPVLAPADRTMPVLSCAGLSSASLLGDFEIAGDEATGTGYKSALWIVGSDLVIEDVAVTGFRESASRGGGAVHVFESAPVFRGGCTFTDNRSTKGGGAVWGRTVSLAFEDVTFTDNQADSGGAINVYRKPYESGDTNVVAIENCVFEENSGGKLGGAIRADRTLLTLTGTSFTGNTAINGGAIALLREAVFDYNFPT
jgi:predicted outer membrane repeat protein